MPEFNLTFEANVSFNTTVEADTLEEAIEISQGRGLNFSPFNDHEKWNIAYVPDEIEYEKIEKLED